MKIIRSTNILLLVLLLLSGLKGFGQNNKLCVGHHWTPKGANLKMKEFASTWNDLESWED